MYEWLLAVHVLAAGLWLGSGITMIGIGRGALARGPQEFAGFAIPAARWGNRVHPAAGLVLLITGPGMLAEADIGFGTTWVVIALVGLLLAFAVGGALVSRTSAKLVRAIESGAGDVSELGRRMLGYAVIEAAIVAVVVVDMVVKPGA